MNYGIGDKNMFKEKFNDLIVGISAYEMAVKNIPSFDNILLLEKFYIDKSTEYINFKNQLEDIKAVLDSLYGTEIDTYIEILEVSFSKISSHPIVVNYMTEVETNTIKNTFLSELYKFEKLIVNDPILVITSDDVDSIFALAKEYVSKATEKILADIANSVFEVIAVTVAVSPFTVSVTKSPIFTSNVLKLTVESVIDVAVCAVMLLPLIITVAA